MVYTQMKTSQYSLKPMQVKKLIASADTPRNRAIIKTLAYTGMRREELASLEVGNVHFKNKVIQVRGKFGKQREVPMLAGLEQELKFIIGTRATGPLFVSRNGGRLASTHINRIVTKVGELAEVTHPNPRKKNINPHLFRHSFARIAKNLGLSIDVISIILGHKDTSTTWNVYGTPDNVMVNEQAKKLEEVFM